MRSWRSDDTTLLTSRTGEPSTTTDDATDVTMALEHVDGKRTRITRNGSVASACAAIPIIISSPDEQGDGAASCSPTRLRHCCRDASRPLSHASLIRARTSSITAFPVYGSTTSGFPMQPPQQQVASNQVQAGPSPSPSPSQHLWRSASTSRKRRLEAPAVTEHRRRTSLQPPPTVTIDEDSETVSFYPDSRGSDFRKTGSRLPPISSSTTAAVRAEGRWSCRSSSASMATLNVPDRFLFQLTPSSVGTGSGISSADSSRRSSSASGSFGVIAVLFRRGPDS